MLDVRKLQAIQAVARHGSISAAARSLHFTAPAISQQLAALERETELELFRRTGRSISLTDAGELLAAHADLVLAQLEAATSALAATRTPSGVLRLAAFPTAIVGVLAPALERLREAFPAVDALVTEAEPELSEQLLRSGRIDVAVVHSYDLVPRQVPDTVQSEQLFDEPMVLVTPATDGMHSPVTLADLRERRWVVPPFGSTCNELVQRACGAAGFVPTVAAQCTDYASTLALVHGGLGVALVPSLALQRASIDGLTVHATEVPLRRYVSVQFVRGRATPALHSLLDLLRAGSVHRASRTPLVG